MLKLIVEGDMIHLRYLETLRSLRYGLFGAYYASSIMIIVKRIQKGNGNDYVPRDFDEPFYGGMK